MNIMARIVIRCDERTKGDWQALKSKIDPDADHEAVLASITDFFEEDEKRVNSVRRIHHGPEFR